MKNEVGIKDDEGIKKISLNFKLWMIRIIIVIYASFYFLPIKISRYFTANNIGGNFGILEFSFMLIYIIAGVLYIIYFMWATDILGKNYKQKLLLFIIMFVSYLYHILPMAHLLAMYNPVFFIPLLLSFMAAFLHFKKFKTLLILFFIFTTCLVMIMRLEQHLIYN